MASMFDYITANAQKLYWETYKASQSEVPFLGDELFPSEKKTGLKLEYIKGANNVAAVLNLSAFDSKVLRRNRIGFESVSTKMPFFKNSLGIDEELRQKLLMLLESNNTAFIDQVIKEIFNDNMNLLKGAAVTRERMRMQLITTGTIAMANNGQEYLYDYGLESYQKVAPVGAKWDDPTADIIGDIISWQDAIEEATGVRPTRMIMRRNIFRLIMKNDYIKNSIYVFGQGKVNASENAIKTFLTEQCGITEIAIYEKIYADEEGTVQHFIPDDTVVLIPEGTLGTTYFGTTPEEADLLGSKEAEVAITDTGVAITTTKQTDPVEVETKVSQICLPSGEQLNKIVIATVIQK